MTKMNELVLPVGEHEHGPKVFEMARIWIDGNEAESRISLNFGIFADRELEVWGSLASDLMVHAVNAYRHNGGKLTTAEAMAVVEKGFRARLADDSTFDGDFTKEPLA